MSLNFAWGSLPRPKEPEVLADRIDRKMRQFFAAFDGYEAGLELDASQVVSGTFVDARISESNVTQHQAALVLTTAQTTTGTFADARISESSVTQHEGSLSIAGSQLTGTIDDARLSSNVMLLDTAQTFSAKKTGETSSGTKMLSTRVTSDINDRWTVVTDGAMEWGDGSSTPDVFISREAAGQLAINSNQDATTFIIGTDLTTRVPALVFRKGGLDRWILRVLPDDNDGDNDGGELEVVRRNDSGGDLGAAMTLRRNTGAVEFSDDIIMSRFADIVGVVATGRRVLSGGVDPGTGANVIVYGPSSAHPNEGWLRWGTTKRMTWSSTGLGFFTSPPVAKPSIEGETPVGGDSRVTSIIAALASLGLATDSTL